MKKKTVNLLTAVGVLVVLSGAYVGVKNYAAKQEEKEQEGEEEKAFSVMSVDTDKIKSIGFLIDKNEVVFEKEDGDWVKSDEKSFPVNKDKLSEAAGTLNSVEADRVLEDVENLSEYGLDAPSNTITVTMEDDEKEVLQVGEENTSTGQYYVKKNGDDSTIYVVESSVVEPFMKELYDYAQADTFPTIDSSTISRISVDESGSSYELVKNDQTGTWNVESEENTEGADSAKASSLASTFSSMSYGKFVNYNCEDLSEYGLDEPYAKITVDYREEIEDENASEESEDSDKSAEPEKSEESEESVDSDKSAEPKKSEELEESEVSDKSAEPEKSEESEESVDTGNTEESTDEIIESALADKQLMLQVGNEADDTGRYVRINDSNAIYTMSNDTLDSFLGKTNEDFWNMTVNYLSVNNLKSLKVAFGNETHIINVSRETSEDEEDSENSTETISYQLDGDDIDSLKFTTFYNKLINMAGQKRLTEEFETASEPEMTVIFTDTDGNTDTEEFYSYDTNFYAGVVGEKVYLINKMTAKEMINTFEEMIGQSSEENSSETEVEK